MGLVNTEHSHMTQSIIDLQADLLKNQFYLFNDKKGLPVDYLNLNVSKSTLDPSLYITYEDHGKDSSFRYNLIKDFYIYGLDRIAINLENGEFGISGSEVSGDAIILPDTITPYVGDNFIINMVKGQRYVFNVTGVTSDTFDNGGNYWRIEYVLDHNNDTEFKDLIVDEYSFVSGNVGTNYSPVLLRTKWDICKILDSLAVSLKQLFKGLYFNNRVQTYTFVYLYKVCQVNMNSDFFYDPYMMEFIIKNKILANSGDKYDYVDHKTYLRPEFGIKYSKSIWKVIENREKEELPGCKHVSSASYIDDPGTIFASRYEDYFELNYNNPDVVSEMFAASIEILSDQVIGHIMDNQLFDYDSKFAKYNLLIKYFNHLDNISTEDVIPIERIMETENNQENYFLIPMLIFVVEYYVKSMMARIDKE